MLHFHLVLSFHHLDPLSQNLLFPFQRRHSAVLFRFLLLLRWCLSLPLPLPFALSLSLILSILLTLLEKLLGCIDVVFGVGGRCQVKRSLLLERKCKRVLLLELKLGEPSLLTDHAALVLELTCGSVC